MTNKVILYVKDEGVNLILSQFPSFMMCHVSLYSYLSHLVVFLLITLRQKHVNMLPMKLSLMQAWRKLAWKMPKLLFKRQSSRLRSPKKVDINGKRKSLFVVMHHPTKKMSWKCKRTTNKVVCTLLDWSLNAYKETTSIH